VDFGFSAEQEAFRSSVRGFLRAEAPVSFARAMMDDETGIVSRVWRSFSDLGWLGLMVPERYGGSGLGHLDLAVLLEECGGVVLPGPLLSTVALGVPAILATADAAQREALLPAIVEGRLRPTLAFAEASGRWDESDVETVAEKVADGYLLRGEKLFVPDARGADVVLVVAKFAGSPALVAVARDAPGVKVSRMESIDATRKLDVVSLDGVVVDENGLLGGTVLAEGVLGRVVDAARVLLSAEMCGAADQALARSVDYAKIRTQFDRPIATFQAIQHKLADMKVLLENARSLVYYAAWALDTNAPDAARAAAMAKAYASDACVKIVADAIQVHGGVGFTWENDLHLYFKRVKCSELTYGDATANRTIVAKSLGV
jgi:alkylation response protein AidB-like acyl-CoA dehydrogenase